MTLSRFGERLRGRFQRTVGELLFRRVIEMKNAVPYVSFTFDDFPRSALHTGGAILTRFGARGTYYAAFGLMGTEAPTGKIFQAEDARTLLAEGHELGCHTYAHCDSWRTKPSLFEASIRENADALRKIHAKASFRSFSYPLTAPHPGAKRAAGRRFASCRGGGQSINRGEVDLNLLKAFFIEKSVDRPEQIRAMIDANRLSNGWLIFATHDVSDSPTPYGCTPSFFETVVKWTLDSGATILPVADALDAILVRCGAQP
jgi:peptidoglycan/xylan/chitin deacetylase (PgdA/CDA1 family)